MRVPTHLSVTPGPVGTAQGRPGPPGQTDAGVPGRESPGGAVTEGKSSRAGGVGGDPGSGGNPAFLLCVVTRTSHRTAHCLLPSLSRVTLQRWWAVGFRRLTWDCGLEDPEILGLEPARMLGSSFLCRGGTL